jgi:N-acetylneuraminate synthase
MKTQTLEFAGRRIGHTQPCFVIAEAGVNHNGDPEQAFALVDAAAAAGADAIKFQTFEASRLVTRDAPKADYQKKNDGTAESQYEMLERLQLDRDMHVALIERCRRRGPIFLSTPFDEQSADLLDDLGVALFKLPSGELTNLPFLAHVARKGKPMIVSTGMCNLREVEEAVEVFEEAGNTQFVLLHCVSNYPADPRDVNLTAMHTLQTAFDAPVGYSDHTLGLEIALASVACGACVLEKHYTLDRTLSGPDHAASLEPDELAQMIRGIRNIEAAVGDGRKRPALSERNTAEVARKSLVAAIDMPAGTRLTTDVIAVKRPGTGLPPSMRPHLLNRTLRVDVAAGSLLDLEMVG